MELPETLSEAFSDDVYNTYLALLFVVAGVFLLAFTVTKRQHAQPEKLTIRVAVPMPTPEIAEGDSDHEPS